MLSRRLGVLLGYRPPSRRPAIAQNCEQRLTLSPIINPRVALVTIPKCVAVCGARAFIARALPLTARSRTPLKYPPHRPFPTLWERGELGEGRRYVRDRLTSTRTADGTDNV